MITRIIHMRVASMVLVFAIVSRAGSLEVATIKPAVPDPVGSSGEDGRNGVLKMWNVSLKRCIRYAYTIPEDQILGGPAWIDERRYDILAKSDVAAGEAELLIMLQPLLAERFRLQLHREVRRVPGYALIAAKGGIKATPAEPGEHSGGNGGRGFIDSTSSTFSGLTIRLTGLLGRTVVDMTGDARKFDFHLRWNPDESETSDRPSLLTALQKQLGVKLEAQTVPVAVLVVDHAELPSPN